MAFNVEEWTKGNVPDFLITVDSVSSPLRITQFRGEESVSRPFQFSIQLESDDFDIAVEDVVGQKARLTIFSQNSIRYIGGIITRFEFLGVEKDVALYHANFNHEISILSQTHQSRIFQNLSVVDIIDEVLTQSGMGSDQFQISCTGSYEPLEYCVQYRESDLDFLNRMAERFGIFYFFKFEEDSCKVVFGDSADVHPQIADGVLPFRDPGGVVDYGDFVYEFRMSNSLRPTTHTVNDYNFLTPGTDLLQQKKSATSNQAEWYEYPGKYGTQNEGASLAKIRSEAADCERSNGSGTSNSVRLVPGEIVAIENHLVDKFNSSYLVTSVVHSGGQPGQDTTTRGDQGYSNKFVIQPAELPYRPPLRTRRPVVKGSQTATVSGPDGHEIYSDEHGRIKVRFHWDRSDSPEDRTSCWIRVSQTWAGKGWGTVIIPRIGQEVIVDFLEGDPDQPIITGSVYNGLNVPPYPLPDKQTVSTMKSDSSLGGDGSNEIRFEDEKGAEEVYFHSQKNLSIVTENDKDQSTGANETLSVGKNRTKSVKGNERSTISGNRSESVTKNEDISIDGNRSVTIAKNESISVDAARSLTVAKKDSVDIGDSSDLKVAKNQSIDIGDNLNMSIGKSYGCDAGDSVLISGGKEIILKCGSASITMKKNGDIQIKGKKLTLKGSGEVVIKGSKITQN